MSWEIFQTFSYCTQAGVYCLRHNQTTYHRKLCVKDITYEIMNHLPNGGRYIEEEHKTHGKIIKGQQSIGHIVIRRGKEQ
jgi:hypothetical protein